MTNADRLTLLALADTMLASGGSVEQLIAASERVFDQVLPWAPAICAAVIERTREHFHYFSRHELAAILGELLGRPQMTDDGDEEDDENNDTGPGYIVLPPVRRYCTDLPIRPPAPAWLAALDLPPLPTIGALSSWLNEPVGALAWLADRWRVAGQGASPLQHYHYRWFPKRSGGLRLLEIPKGRLRRIQHAILRGILDRVPAHPAAHGFTRGRSCLTHASLHTGQALVLRMDVKDFFTSIPHARVHALFEKLGYSTSVAGTLARLCVNRTPRGALAELAWAERQPFAAAHLPQGSPCSPALANLCAYRLDLRLAALAQSMGATYSRYADDLTFSGGPAFARAGERFAIRVAAISLEEGFAVNHRKTRLMRQGARQQVTGVVVNRHPNRARPEYDRLKAILSNCVRHGPASQNRARHADFRAHLAGRLTWLAALNPARAARLQRVFDSIAW
jgi:RNA-directed DNA polymerase